MKIPKYRDLWLVVLALWLLSCKEVEQIAVTPGSPRKLLVLLCDLTTSTDSSTTREKMLANVDKLLEDLPAGTYYYVYPIGKNIQSALFKGYTGDDADQATTYDNNVADYMACKEKIAAAFAKAPSDGTCVIDALEAVTSQINFLKKEIAVDSTKLVVISDMLEACTVNNMKVNLEKIPFDTAIANRLLTEWPTGRQFLADTDLIDISILFNTDGAVDYHQLTAFWKRFFRKAGHQKEVSFALDLGKK